MSFTLPPTHNTLDASDRIRLMRSTRKLGRLLGVQPMLVERDTDTPPQPFHQRFHSDPGFQRSSKRKGRIFNVSPRHTPSPNSTKQTSLMLSHVFPDFSPSSTESPSSSRDTTPSPNASILSLPLATPRSSMDQLPLPLSFSKRGRSFDVPHPLVLQLHPASSSADIDAGCNDLNTSAATAHLSDLAGRRSESPLRTPSDGPTSPSYPFSSSYPSSLPTPDEDEESDSDIEFAQNILSTAQLSPPTHSHARSQSDDFSSNSMQRRYHRQFLKLERTLGAGVPQELVFRSRSASQDDVRGDGRGSVSGKASADDSFGFMEVNVERSGADEVSLDGGMVGGGSAPIVRPTPVSAIASIESGRSGAVDGHTPTTATLPGDATFPTFTTTAPTPLPTHNTFASPSPPQTPTSYFTPPTSRSSTPLSTNESSELRSRPTSRIVSVPLRSSSSRRSDSQSRSASNYSPLQEATAIANGNFRGPGVAFMRPKVESFSPSRSASPCPRSASPFPLTNTQLSGGEYAKGGSSWVQPSSSGRSTVKTSQRTAFDGSRVRSFPPGSLTDVDLRPLLVDDGVLPSTVDDTVVISLRDDAWKEMRGGMSGRGAEDRPRFSEEAALKEVKRIMRKDIVDGNGRSSQERSGSRCGMPGTFSVGETSKDAPISRQTSTTSEVKQRRRRSTSVNSVFTSASASPSSVFTLVSPHSPPKASIPRRVGLPPAVPPTSTSTPTKSQAPRSTHPSPSLSVAATPSNTLPQSHKQSRSVSSSTTTASTTPSFHKSLPRIPSSLRLSKKKSKVALHQLQSIFGESSSASSSDAENTIHAPVIPPVPALPTGLDRFATAGRASRERTTPFVMIDASVSETDAEGTDVEVHVARTVREGQGYMIGSGPRAPEGERWVGEWNVKDISSVQSALRRLK